MAKHKFSQGGLVRIEIRIERRVIIITSLKWWAWLVPPLDSLWWTIPVVVVVVVVEVGTIFTGLMAVVPRVSIIATDFTREVRTHGVDGSLNLSLAPFIHLLDEEVQFHGNHIRLLDGMHALCAGLESFITPPLVGDHLVGGS